MILFLIVFCLLVAIGFGIAAAISDFKTMNIPNIYSVGIALAFVPAYAADALTGAGAEFFSGWQSHLAAGAGMFAVTFGLYALKLIGAGDSKLCSAFALWMAAAGLPAFLFYMTVAGGLLGIATKIMNGRVLMKDAPEGSWIAKAQAGGVGVPYGIAITLGAVIAFWQAGYFSPERLALLTGGF